MIITGRCVLKATERVEEIYLHVIITDVPTYNLPVLLFHLPPLFLSIDSKEQYSLSGQRLIIN
jgi:hypothetical protein